MTVYLATLIISRKGPNKNGNASSTVFQAHKQMGLDTLQGTLMLSSLLPIFNSFAQARNGEFPSCELMKSTTGASATGCDL